MSGSTILRASYSPRRSIASPLGGPRWRMGNGRPRSTVIAVPASAPLRLDTETRPLMRLLRLELKNFLSYRQAEINLGQLTALVGPNASGKSNAMAALKLLRDIPEYGLQTALLR